jgi:hypothetical protein
VSFEMSITVVVRRRARPGREEALIAAMTDAIARPHARASTRARVFQGLGDPQAILYIGQWADRGQYRSRNNPAAGLLDDLCSEPPERLYCQQLDLYEAPAGRVGVASCVIVQAAPTAAAALITYLFERSGPALYETPGLVLRAVYQDLDVPCRLLTLIGWHSRADQEAARLRLGPLLDPPLFQLGATVERFLARTRVDVDRAPVPL